MSNPLYYLGGKKTNQDLIIYSNGKNKRKIATFPSDSPRFRFLRSAQLSKEPAEPKSECRKLEASYHG